MTGTKRKAQRLRAPFLRRLAWIGTKAPTDRFPLNLPIFASGTLALDFSRPLALFVGENGFRETDYRDTPHYRLVRDFLNAPDRFLRGLMRDEEAKT